MGAVISYQNKVLKSNKIEIERLDNNWNAQIEINQNKDKDHAKVLKLKLEEFKDSKDSLVNILNNTKNKLGIKDKQLVQAQGIITKLSDTTKTTIPIKKDSLNNIINCDFKIEEQVNPQTYFMVERVDTTLTHIINIKNVQSLFYSLNKEWEVKGFFKRLVKFNWKKKDSLEFWIDNSNDKIKIEDTRIINITK